LSTGSYGVVKAEVIRTPELVFVFSDTLEEGTAVVGLVGEVAVTRTVERRGTLPLVSPVG